MHTLQKMATRCLALLLIAGLFVGIKPQTADAASTDTITVSGTYNYTMANSVFSEVNKQRSSAGASKLTLDQTLTKEAMKRAAEISVYYSHTRPNGSAYTTAYSKLGGASAENIAAGQKSASAVMTSWMNSSGHKKNILNKSYKSMGIGSFTNNGTTYWVQVFSSKSGSSASKSGTVDTTVSVSAKGSYISGCLTLSPASSSIEKGKTTSITAYVKNKGASGFKAKVNAGSLKWSSGSSSVATVTSSGTVTGKAAGSAKITAKTSAGGASANTTITVKSSSTTTSKTTTSQSTGSTTSKTTTSQSTGSTTTSKATTSTTSQSTGSSATSKSTGSTAASQSSGGTSAGSSAVTTQKPSTDLANCKVTLTNVCYTYDGQAKQPAVIVRDGSTTLQAGTDYTVTYADNVNVGSGKAIVTGKGKYTGSVTMSFAIKRAAAAASTSTTLQMTATAPAAPEIISVKSPASGVLEVAWNPVSDATGYVLTYSTSEKFYSSSAYDTKGFDIYTKDSVGDTFLNLRKGETYYVKLAAYKSVDGKRFTSDASNVLSARIAR